MVGWLKGYGGLSMPKMLPGEISPNANEFERYLFEKFKKMPHTTHNKWVIFHDVGVAGGPGRDRQLDFVILIPGEPYDKDKDPREIAAYSVIYLEAKGGKYTRRDRQWFLNSKPVPAPTEQSSSGMYHLKNEFENYIKGKLHGDPLCLSFVHAVAFRDWDVSEQDAKEADVTKGALLIGGKAVDDSKELAKRLRDHAIAERNKHDPMVGYNWGPNGDRRLRAEKQTTYLEEKLNFTIAVPDDTFYRHNLDTLLRELLKLTDVQKGALTTIELNSRCVIDGAAGTGKTVLAMEVVQQRCEERGDTVGLLCSNPILSSRFERWAEGLSDERGGRVVVGTPASLLAHAFADDAGFVARHRERLEAAPNLESTLKRGALDDGWRGFVAETLTELEGKAAVFDYLVIDEAQNLCDDVFMQLLDRLVKGGLVHGRWTMFGDFENQNIVTPRRGVGDEVDAFGAYYTKYKLYTNCRNTDEIAAATENITDIKAPTLPGVHGPDVEYQYFDSNARLPEMLDKQLKEWDDYGFEPQQITILIGGDDNILDTNRRYGKWKLVNIAEAPSGSDVRVSGDDSPYVRYSNIYDFQGLESHLVILVLPMAQGQQTDLGGTVTLPHHNYLNRLLYIAMSRANAMLVVMADEGYRAHLEGIF